MRDLKPKAPTVIREAMESFIRLTILTLWVPFTVITDLVILGNRLGERSVTEFTQSLVLLVTAILIADTARHDRASRGFLTLVSGLMACMFIRETDLVLDKLVTHGFWCPLALAAAAVTAAVAWRNRATILPGAAAFIGTKPYYYMQFGFLVLIVLSRSLGSGRLLWNLLGYDDTHRLFKTIIQESLESFGYILMCFGAFALRREREAPQCASRPDFTN